MELLKSDKNKILTHFNEVLKIKKRNLNREFSFDKVANSTINKGYLNGSKIDRIIFYLRSTGCEWSCTKMGGCFMCGHYFGTNMGDTLPKNSFYNQFLSEYNKYDFSKYPMICIYNAGSILNDNEIPREELYRILNVIKRNNDIKRVVLESRPEFINVEVLNQISNILNDKIVEIGIGLETSNDKVREYCINKGFNFKNYLEKVKLIKNYSNIKTLTYVTVKLLFLTIDESIRDVIQTMKDLSGLTDIISLEPISIQKNTLVELLYTNKLYDPPKGWIIKEILANLHNTNLMKNFELRIGGFEFFPIPDLFISNCNKCNKKLYDAIDIYNSTKDVNSILTLSCDCYEEFKKKIYIENNTVSHIPLEERICNSLEYFLYKSL
ncbi:hypothetical protein BJV85_003837 [Clostridium acetobutylicum]|uniref:Archaeal-type Fe-S oxidoreductase n=1 Tax=Clostridium acetobutylicum (strain ATCC 824 / DSM 792 / JCM 1419 / IAM 19013 / LMG 5710 / NBRC 13948 / NRRL B-527 / VKM B-1787 / 2291 / W) TaxID=272562 RepID=Q97TD9_CLOAB|nr:radical SAM protein [Clostridium acetobutylicum]AAK76918.1 Archaeal-type Fe-S oxidoreductase [Clostridium acetobutylicum ATCC 824]ADZ22954.1 Archaeal-type Fe-S oxidoreductase [Clostridium acetobutylicum EA 2018]AEI34914.1 Fe-S oxidoreductase [Clostridium acetobutylicum DSM 1731]PSM04322.1 radical SAM protein [Clostridium sp. NJ4]AWV82285.1 radical SAM protein [Clostridium acetobutylicum]